jgi:RNA recognition motif-containing protein
MTKIYVGNLSYDSSETDLRTAFERFGDVSSIRLVTDQATGRSRGFAFVTMRRLDDADEAIARMNGSSLGGRRLVVNEARDRGESPQRPRAARQDLWQLIESQAG